MPEIIRPEEESNLETGKLVDSAVSAFNKKDYQGLDEALLKLGRELGVELETKYDKVLEKNQKLYDALFPERNLNLKALYTEGKLPFPDRTQEKALLEEGYKEYLIIPNNLAYQDLETRIHQLYQEKIENYQPIWYSKEAQEDLPKIQTKDNQTQEDGFYLLALKEDTQTIDAHPETTSKTLQEQFDILAQEQTNHPDLNLRGTKLKESLLYEAFVFETTGKHADESSVGRSYNRCLEDATNDKQGHPIRALSLNWHSVYRELGVLSDSYPFDNIGARFAAVFTSS